MSKLDDLGIDAFCDAVIDGKNYRRIAEENGCTAAFVVKWLAADSERSARARAARVISAQSADEMAEEVLRDTELDPMIRRELASHYRWRAKVVNPREYGEKVQIDATMSVNTLTDAQIEARAMAIRARLGEVADRADAEYIAAQTPPALDAP